MTICYFSITHNTLKAGLNHDERNTVHMVSKNVELGLVSNITDFNVDKFVVD